MSAQVTSLVPEWGVNYDRGYIGFTHCTTSLISKGIAYFEHWDRMGDIPVSHVLIVTGWDQCVEALPSGVSSSPLAGYFNDPHTLIFFRKPRYYSRELGNAIAASGTKHIGDRYGYALLLAHAFKGSLLGKIFARLTWDWSDRLFSRILDSRKQQICSELAAHALNEQPLLRGLGCLRQPDRLINPQMLFEDDAIFERWRSQSFSVPKATPSEISSPPQPP